MSAPDTTPTSEQPGPVHFLDGIRCIWCQTLNASWLWADRVTVECAECGQTSLTLPDPTPNGEGA